MDFRWFEDTDNYGTKTAQLVFDGNTVIEIVQYDDEDGCEIYGDLYDLLQFSDWYEDIETAKKAVEDTIHNFCVEFNTWWQR